MKSLLMSGHAILCSALGSALSSSTNRQVHRRNKGAPFRISIHHVEMVDKAQKIDSSFSCTAVDHEFNRADSARPPTLPANDPVPMRSPTKEPTRTPTKATAPIHRPSKARVLSCYMDRPNVRGELPSKKVRVRRKHPCND